MLSSSFVPTYEYECDQCKRTFEVRQRISEPPLTVCEQCGGSVRRLLAAAAFILKGEGWYVTDYPSESRKKGKQAETGNQRRRLPPHPRLETGSLPRGPRASSETSGSSSAGGSGSTAILLQQVRQHPSPSRKVQSGKASPASPSPTASPSPLIHALSLAPGRAPGERRSGTGRALPPERRRELSTASPRRTEDRRGGSGPARRDADGVPRARPSASSASPSRTKISRRPVEPRIAPGPPSRPPNTPPPARPRQSDPDARRVPARATQVSRADRRDEVAEAVGAEDRAETSPPLPRARGKRRPDGVR